MDFTAEDNAALEAAYDRFSKRDYTQGNHRIRPEGISIFKWLSDAENKEAFKQGQDIMKMLETP